jgi:hypothetical protein
MSRDADGPVDSRAHRRCHSTIREGPPSWRAFLFPLAGWPAGWQREAIEAVLPHLGTDERLHILVGDPKKSIHGTLIGGHVHVEDGTPMIIHDRSGRQDVFPGQLLSGPFPSDRAPQTQKALCLRASGLETSD